MNILVEPACDVGCRTCLMGCAVLPARVLWWQREVERLCRERSLRPSCLETRRALDIALSGHEGLMQQLRDSPRGAFLEAPQAMRQ